MVTFVLFSQLSNTEFEEEVGELLGYKWVWLQLKSGRGLTSGLLMIISGLEEPLEASNSM